MKQIHNPVGHSLHNTSALGAALVMYLFQRMHAGIFGGRASPPRCLTEDCAHATQYCLDAPERLPAGGMAFHSFGPDADEWCPKQITCNREWEESK